MQKERAEEKPVHNMNRGSHMWYHPAGFKIFMYTDEPGVYRDLHDNVLPEALITGAAEPHEIKRYTKQRKIKADQDLAASSIQAALDAEERWTVEERSEYRLVAHSTGFYTIERIEDGSQLTPRPVSEMIARTTLDQLDPKVEEVIEEPLLFAKKG